MIARTPSVWRQRSIWLRGLPLHPARIPHPVQHRHRLHGIRADDDDRTDAAQALPQRLADIDVLDAPQRDVVDAGADEPLLDGQPTCRERILALLQAHEADEPHDDGERRQGDQQDPLMGDAPPEVVEGERSGRSAEGDDHAAQDGARVLALARRRRPQQPILLRWRCRTPREQRRRGRSPGGCTRRCPAARAEGCQGGDLLAAFPTGNERHVRARWGRPRHPP